MVTMVTRGDMGWPGKGACDATHLVTTCHKKRTFKDLISCGFHNLKINMAHAVKCSKGLVEACSMLFLRNMALED